MVRACNFSLILGLVLSLVLILGWACYCLGGKMVTLKGHPKASC